LGGCTHAWLCRAARHVFVEYLDEEDKKTVKNVGHLGHEFAISYRRYNAKVSRGTQKLYNKIADKGYNFYLKRRSHREKKEVLSKIIFISEGI
jgi:hypothetical protein